MDDGKGAGRGWLNLPFAAITLDGSKGGKSLTPEGEKKLHKLLSEMTPEERSEVGGLLLQLM